jgi:hypothetical protein
MTALDDLRAILRARDLLDKEVARLTELALAEVAQRTSLGVSVGGGLARSPGLLLCW